MLLYRYFATHVLDTLRDKRLKVARIGELNDPFECRFAAVGEISRAEVRDMKENKAKAVAQQMRARGLSEAKIKKAVRKIRHENVDLRGALKRSKIDIVAYQEEILETDTRVLCFAASPSEGNSEILMWSHYTNGHRGGRIGFEIPDQYVRAMKYSRKRVAVDLTDLGRPGGDEVIRRALLRSNEQKSEEWSYEREYRFFIGTEVCQKEGRLEFLPFDPAWVQRVDLGLRFPPDVKEHVLALLRSAYPSVKCYQAEFHPTDYALAFKRTD